MIWGALAMFPSYFIIYKEKNDRNWWLAQSIGGRGESEPCKIHTKAFDLKSSARRFCEFIALECFPLRAAAATWKWFAGCEVSEFIGGGIFNSVLHSSRGVGGCSAVCRISQQITLLGCDRGELLGASTPYQGGHYWPLWIAESYTCIFELMKHSTINRQIC